MFTCPLIFAMSAERSLSEPEAPARGTPAAPKKAPLPQARRAAPSVNLDAGEWAVAPGRMPPAVAEFRWALEELRLALFVPELAGRPAMTVARVESLGKNLPRP